MPRLGLGLWRVTKQKELDEAIKTALKSGYTHFDSAQVYGNEAMLGAALKKARVKREDMFITTKLWNDNQWDNDVDPSFDESLKKLQMDYVDLFLVHFPVTQTRRMAWMRMEEIYKSGKAKAIGVSNYTVRHLEELLQWCDEPPMVNQVELHVFLQQPDLVDFCKKHDIVVQAYSPLAHGHRMDDPVLKEIADKHDKSVAQVMIRWCLEKGTVPLPKSVTPERIKENVDVFDFDLDADDMDKLDHLDDNYRTCWDPTNVP